MKRFKTKQELQNAKGVGCNFGRDNSYHGLPATEKDIRYYHSEMFTDDPHPYDGKQIKIIVRSPKISEKIQKLAFKLGYKWNGDGSTKIEFPESPYLYFNNSFITHGVLSSSFNDDSYTELTPKQFLDQWWPEEKENVLDKEPEKDDAYITESGGFYIWKDGIEVYHTSPVPFRDMMQQFNLISEKEFIKKYHKALVFKGHEITKDYDNTQPQFKKLIKVGCETFTLHELTAFYYVSKIIQDNRIDLTDVIEFIDINRNKLEI